MRAFYFVGTLMLVILAHTLEAQVVNIETARMQSDTTGWMGSAGAGFSLDKNTTQIYNLTMEAHLQYKTKKDLWLLLGDNIFLKGGGEKLISNNFIHLRYNRKLNAWLRLEAFTQVQSNLVTQIKSRFLTGVGPRVKLIGSRKLKVYVASLIMYENEKESTKPVITHSDMRSSSYMSITYLPTSTVELTSTLFFQPLLKNIYDNRVFNQTSCRVKASKHFGMYMKWNYLHDRRPAGTAPKTTYNLSTGFDFQF
ncbi:MAG TPA: DUF481 domain-containing protein [Chlamydiales bacterium]|nr:DUF481 domain-containing protein [Chlamydiales bacterium]